MRACEQGGVDLHVRTPDQKVRHRIQQARTGHGTEQSTEFQQFGRREVTQGCRVLLETRNERFDVTA